MSYEVDTSKLITIGNLRNFYDRLWDEMSEEHNIMMEAFQPGGAAVTTDADIDEALFGIVAPSTPSFLSANFQEQCPEDPKYGEHSWTEASYFEDGNHNITGWQFVCEACGATIKGSFAEPDNSCGTGNHTWMCIDSATHKFICTTCGYEVHLEGGTPEGVTPADEGY